MLGGAWMKELVERVGSLNDESVLNLTKETLHKQMNITASPVHTKVHYQMVNSLKKINCSLNGLPIYPHHFISYLTLKKKRVQNTLVAILNEKYV